MSYIGDILKYFIIRSNYCKKYGLSHTDLLYIFSYVTVQPYILYCNLFMRNIINCTFFHSLQYRNADALL